MRALARVFLICSALLLLLAAGLTLFVEGADCAGERAYRARGCGICHDNFSSKLLRALQGWKPGEALRPRVRAALAAEHPWLTRGAEVELAEYLIAQQYTPLAAEQTSGKGERLYRAKCAACHGRAGEGQAGAYPPLQQSEWLSDPVKRARLPEILTEGLQGPITVKGESWDSIMNAPGLRDEAEREAVMRYVGEAFGGMSATR